MTTAAKYVGAELYRPLDPDAADIVALLGFGTRSVELVTEAHYHSLGSGIKVFVRQLPEPTRGQATLLLWPMQGKTERTLLGTQRSREALFYESRIFHWHHEFTSGSTLTGTRVDPPALTATVKLQIPGEVRAAASVILDDISDEEFEFGIESHLSAELEKYIKRHGMLGITVLAELILADECKPNIAAEALRTLGRINDPKTYYDRLDLLEHTLFHRRSAIRSGAIVGLAHLDDPSAIPTLQRAFEAEKAGWLRNYIDAVLDQLNRTKTQRNAGPIKATQNQELLAN